MISTLTKLAFLPVGLYLIFVIAAHFQQVQREILFLNWLSFPNPETLKTPSLYGFPENQVRNFYIESKQNRKLGAWQITPLDSYWNEVNQGNKDFDGSYYDSFFTNKSTTTVLYLHGNAGNRATKHRPFTYQKLAGKNQFNVIAVDYSGFGDSEGKPTEKAIVEDAKATWDWIIQKGASPDRIVVLGHSLGTAVATKLTEELQDQNIAPKALILKAPFSNVKRAVFDFKILARYSILGPLGRVPQLKSYINNVLKLDFDSLSIIGKLKLPILILHGYEDNVLPIIHGETLYQEVMNSAKYETTTITQGIPQSVQVFSSEKNDHLIQFAKFKHIDHDNFHRFDTVFLIIQKFWDKISQ